jgi:hypothetical protein
MTSQIKESDWKLLRQLEPLALDRFCQRVLAEVKQVTSRSTESHHQRFLDVFRLIINRNKELAAAFDDLRRSNAILKLAAIKSHDLLTDEEFSRFSMETREAVNIWLK